MSATRQMPPWQEATYFQEPVISQYEFTGVPGGWVQVAPASGNRVALLLSANTTSNGFSPAPLATDAGGLCPAGGIGTLEITEAKFGPLAQSAWYYCDSLAGPITVVVCEIILREWPASRHSANLKE